MTMSPTFAVIASGKNPKLGAIPVATGFNPPTRTVCVAAPADASGARLMTFIDWAAARPATSGSAWMYFIMTTLLCCKGRGGKDCRLALQAIKLKVGEEVKGDEGRLR